MERANGFTEFYSRMTAGGKIEYFVDKYGSPTTNYPHVHVVHHGSGRVEVIARDGSQKHLWRTVLNNPTGNEVNNAIQTARSYL